MNRSLFAPLLLVGPAFLPAQTVVVSAMALTPVTCQVTVGAVAQTQSLPVGPLAASGSLGPTLGAPSFGSAQLGWSAAASETAAEFLLTTYTQLAGGQARVGPGELLVTFTGVAPTAMPVRFEVTVEYTGDSGSTRQLALDVGNDGTIEWHGLPWPPFGAPVADLTTQPLVLRVILDDLRTVPGQSSARLRIRVVPDHVHVLRMATNCGLPHAYSVDGFFDRSQADLQIRGSPVAWHVFGLQTQPALLPASLTLTTVPCFVIPRPDVVLRSGTIFLAVPPALRPVSFFTQLLDFAGGLRVSDAFQVIVL